MAATPARPRCTSSPPPPSRPPTSPTCCAGRTCSAGCRGRRWRSSSAPPVRWVRCAARWRRPACPSRSRLTISRWPVSRRSPRSSARSRPCCRRRPRGRRPTARPWVWTSPPPRRCSPHPSGEPPSSTSGDCGAPSGSSWRGRASTRPSAAPRWPRRCSTRCCWRRCPSTSPGRPGRSPPSSTPAGSPWRKTARPRTCCGRCGSAAAWPPGGPAPALPVDRPVPSPTATSMPSSRSSTPPPGSSADVRAFVAHLSAQELPGDTGAARAVAGDTVRLLTAHASKGLEWDLVCVAGVQEGVWPDLRERTSLLGTEELVERASGIDGAPVDRRTLALAEERRLFYVACTRARRRLVVTAVEGALDGADAGATASRFLDLVAAPPEDGRPLTELPRSLTLPALVADLRRALTDPQTPPDRRAAAASVLRRLADEGVPGAGPAGWWGLAPLSDDAPLVPEEAPVRVRPSAIETFQRCPLKWVLSAVGAEASPDTTRTVGTAVHDVAQQVADGLPPEEAPAALDAELDQLDLGPGWSDQRQRQSAQDMLGRFLAWHTAGGRQLVAAEVEFDATVGRVVIRGKVDRLERDADGRLVVVDLKTGKTPAKNTDEHGQLAAYQVAVAAGGFGEHGGVPGGAALLQVGTGAKAKEQHQEPLPADVPLERTWAGQLITTVGEGMGAATFEVRTGSHCQRCPARRSCPLQESGRQVTS